MDSGIFYKGCELKEGCFKHLSHEILLEASKETGCSVEFLSGGMVTEDQAVRHLMKRVGSLNNAILELVNVVKGSNVIDEKFKLELSYLEEHNRSGNPVLVISKMEVTEMEIISKVLSVIEALDKYQKDIKSILYKVL